MPLGGGGGGGGRSVLNTSVVKILAAERERLFQHGIIQEKIFRTSAGKILPSAHHDEYLMLQDE